MTEQPAISSVTAAEWRAQIAEKAKAPPEEVDRILTNHGIEVQSIIPRRRTISLSSIQMIGTKSGVMKDGIEVPGSKFDFQWNDLGPGIWVIASDSNNSGKSSVLNAFKAAIKGKFPGAIKDDIWSWLSELCVEFKLDGVLHRVVVTKASGSKSTNAEGAFHARLDRNERGSWNAVNVADDGDAFENVMSDFFMQELGFEKFQAYQQATDSKNAHGWPAMGSALFITGAAPALFGEVLTDSLALRLLQLFIGLPWVSTYTTLQTNLKQIQAENGRISDASKRARASILAELEELTKQREILQAEKADLPDRVKIRRDQRETDLKLASAMEKRSRLRKQAIDLDEEFAAASSDYDLSRNMARQLEDEFAAGHVFRRLRPTTCPSCDEAVHVGEHDPGTCPLCGVKERVESDETPARIEAIRTDERRAKEARDKLGKERASIQRALEDVEASISDLESRLTASENALQDSRKSAELDEKVANLAGGIDALTRALPPESQVESSDDARILSVAAKVTEGCFHDLQVLILSHFSGELMRIASLVGVENLQSVDVRANRIDIFQGGTATTFGKLNPGERLRFRIAAALAAVETAKWSGAGRHPGLLILNSPAAHEMATDDFVGVLGGLQALLDEQPDVQVIVGALMRPQISRAVPDKRLKYAEGDSKLF